jgi:hypothetical protein
LGQGGFGIRVCSNEVDTHSTRDDNSKRVKNTSLIILNLLQNQPDNFNQLGTNHPRVKGIDVCSNNRPGQLQWNKYKKGGKL